MASRADRFEQLKGVFDDPIAPAPAFAGRLRENVLAELAAAPASAAPHGIAREVPMAAISHVTAAPVRALRPGRPRRTARILRWTKPMVLVNVAAILLLLVGIVRLLAPDKPAHTGTYRLPAIASQTSGTPLAPNISLNGPAAMWGANPGRTWAFTSPVPDPTKATLSTLTSGSQGAFVISSIVLDHRMFIALKDGNGTFALKAIDLSSGREEWSKPMMVNGAMAAKGDVLFALAADNSTGTTAQTLVALSASDGSEVWRGPSWSGMGPIAPPALNGLLVQGDKLYLPTRGGQVLEIDASTGRTLQTLGLTVARPFIPDDGPHPAGSIAIANGTLYMINADAKLEAIRLSDNTSLWTMEPPRATAPLMLNAYILVSNGRVVVGAMNGILSVIKNQQTYRPLKGAVIAYDATTGREVWATRRCRQERTPWPRLAMQW